MYRVSFKNDYSNTESCIQMEASGEMRSDTGLGFKKVSQGAISCSEFAGSVDLNEAH